MRKSVKYELKWAAKNGNYEKVIDVLIEKIDALEAENSVIYELLKNHLDLIRSTDHKIDSVKNYEDSKILLLGSMTALGEIDIDKLMPTQESEAIKEVVEA